MRTFEIKLYKFSELDKTVQDEILGYCHLEKADEWINSQEYLACGRLFDANEF